MVKEGTPSDRIYLVKKGEFAIVKNSLNGLKSSEVEYLFKDSKEVKDRNQLGL